MIKEIFQEQKQCINHFFEQVSLNQIENFFQACQSCNGLLILTGVGKSGIIAEKIALTLASTGSRAVYLTPLNFLHGDIGIIRPQDHVIMLSKSGETEELLDLIPHIKRKGAKIFAVTSKMQSRLESVADLTLHLPVLKELCPFDLAPTTSTSVQLLFGDLLVAALMKAKNFSLDEYAQNHPSGSIGKKMTVYVKDLMLKESHLPLCAPSNSVVDILVDLSDKRCGCMLIADTDRRLIGIFTDGDLRRALQREGPKILDKKMAELMTRNPISVSPDLLAHEAVKIMQRDPNRYVLVAPVTDSGRVVGIIRMHDIIQAGI